MKRLALNLLVVLSIMMLCAPAEALRGNCVFAWTEVKDGVLYAATEDGILYVRDAVTGKEMWKFEVEPVAMPILEGVVPVSRPCTVDGIAYFGASDGYIHAVEIATGQEKWHSKPWETLAEADSKKLLYGLLMLSGPPAYMVYPTLVNGLLIIGDTQSLVAADPRTSEGKWRFASARALFPYCPLVISDGAAYIMGDRRVHAVDISTGEEKWQVPTHEWDDARPIAACDGVVCLSGSKETMSYKRDYYFLDAHTKELKWKFDAVVASAIADGYIVIACDDMVVYCADLKTGAMKWKYAADSQVMQSPIIVDGVVYFASYSLQKAYVYAVDIKTGKELWKINPKNWTGVPVVADGVVCFRDKEGVRAVDAKTGADKWTYPAKVLDLKIHGGLVYIPWANGDLYVVDSQSGDLKWEATFTSKLPEMKEQWSKKLGISKQKSEQPAPTGSSPP